MSYLSIDNSISIHALLAESDEDMIFEEQMDEISIHALLAESDLIPHQQKCGNGISIHALLAESDRNGVCPAV